MNKIKERLTKLYNQHRVVLWYDHEKEFHDILMDINPVGVVIIEGNRNNLEIKIIVNSEENENNKYLLYFPYEKPPNEANWLLDLELAYHVFQTDKESLYLEELGIENTYRDIVSKHIKFFESRDRRKKLKEIIDTDKSLTLDRILQVVFNLDFDGLC